MNMPAQLLLSVCRCRCVVQLAPHQRHPVQASRIPGLLGFMSHTTMAAAAPPGPPGVQPRDPPVDRLALASMSSIARLMDRSEELVILRRFDELHLLNLLMMQDEIDQLLREFSECEPAIEDEPSSLAVPLWYSLPRPAVSQHQATADKKSESEIHARRLTVWNNVRAKLREYGESALCDPKTR